MKLADAFILIIGDDGILLVPPLAKSEPLFIAGCDRERAESLLETMASQPHKPVYILADILAQEYRQEILPQLNWFDRRKLLARRLQQHFAQAFLTTALTFRNHNLLACVHKGGPLQEWVGWLADIPNPFGGISLLPLESACMLARLHPETRNGWALLLSWQRTGGFRQIVTQQGELIFTRLTPSLPINSDPHEIADIITRDLQASLGYLARLGLTDSNQLSIVAVIPEKTHSALQAMSLPVQSVTTVAPHQAAKQLGLAFAPALNDPTSDLLHAGWFMQKKKPRVTLMRSEDRQAHQARQVKYWGRMAATACWLFTLAYIGWQGQDLLRLTMVNHAQTEKMSALQQQLADERKTLTPVTEPLGRLQQAVERKRLFTTPTPTPWDILDDLDTGLGDAARLTKLHWQNDGTESLEISVKLANKENIKPEERQAVIEQFDRIAQHLQQKLSGYSVQITHYPFPSQSEEILSNSREKSSDTPAIADFKLARVIR